MLRCQRNSNHPIIAKLASHFPFFILKLLIIQELFVTLPIKRESYS